MEQIYNYNENCFEVFLGEKIIGDVGDLLMRTINYLKQVGKKVNFKGVNEENMPVVEVNGEKYYFKRVVGHINGARFIRIKEDKLNIDEEINNNDERVYDDQKDVIYNVS